MATVPWKSCRASAGRSDVVLPAGDEELELRKAHDELEARVRERMAELARVNRELRRSNHELENCASVVLHDLKEPLCTAQMLGMTVARQYGDQLPQPVRRHLERQQRAFARMQALITDVLAFSRLSAQKPQFVAVDLAVVVSGVLEDLQSVIDETGATVETGSLPAVTGAPTQLRQLFQNLIGNALKFHRPGVPPRVRIQAGSLDENRRHRQPDTPAMHEIRIADNGTGFDMDQLEHMFSLFGRLHDREEYPGSGLGLTVCREIVQRHGGCITAESIPGQGSCFIIRLPATRSERRAVPLRDAAVELSGPPDAA